MVNCSAYIKSWAKDGNDGFCNTGETSKRNCSGCCCDCLAKCDSEMCNEPSKCTAPDNKGVDTND